MTNRFGGTCTACGTRVQPGEGDTTKSGGRWVVAHLICPVTEPRDEDDESFDAWQSRPVEPGMYSLPDGTIVKVQNAVHGSGRPYAKRLVVTPGETKGTFVYEAGLLRAVSPEMRLTADAASAFGHLYGMCCVCAATLTDERSIAAGIGPVCAGRL